MATPPVVDEFKKTLAEFQAIDRDRLFRADVGTHSLKETLSPQLEQVKRDLERAESAMPRLHDNHANGVNATLRQLVNQLNGIVALTDAQFIDQREKSINSVRNLVEQFSGHNPPIVAALVLDRGILSESGIRDEVEDALRTLKAESESILKKQQENASKILADAEVLAKSIEEKARSTAAKISVKEAQDQFSQAASDLTRQIKIWISITAGAFVLFIGVSAYFLFLNYPSEELLIFHTAIRIVVLTAFGGFALYSLKMLRAHVHLQHLNAHRQRLANSIAAFVQAADTPEQRDAILLQLVGTISDFGQSGLIPREGEGSGPASFVFEAFRPR